MAIVIFFDSAHILSGYIDDSKIKGNARIEGFLTIVNSTIENGEYTVLDKSKTGGIENATLLNLYVANSVYIKNSTVEAKEAFHSEKLLYVENSTILMTSGTGVKECAFTDVEITINSFASFQAFGISCFKMNSKGDFTIDEDKSKPESKTVIQGEKENPVEFRGELWLRISDTIIVGSALVEGNLNIVSCRIEGMPVIKMNGSLFTSQISDCAQIDCPLSEVHYLENLIVGEDAVHTVVYF